MSNFGEVPCCRIHARSPEARGTSVLCGRLRLLHAGDVGGQEVSGQEVSAASVEVAEGAVVVLDGAGVGVAGQDLGVAQGYAGVEGVW